MMKKLAFFAAALLVAGCVGTSRPSHFYNLNSMQSSDIIVTFPGKYRIAVDEIKIPSYLDKPQIVTAVPNSGQLDISEFNRWSEPLSTMLQRTIADDMSMYLPGSMVKPLALYQEKFDYIVNIEVNRFEGSFDGRTVLDAWWTVMDKRQNVVLSERSEFSEETGKGYDNLIKTESRLVGSLSREISEKIAELK